LYTSLKCRCSHLVQKNKSKEPSDDLDDDDLDGEDDSSSQPLTTHFELNDTLFAEAEIEDTDEVYLWLGVRLI
jgi:hypothetical protein